MAESRKPRAPVAGPPARGLLPYLVVLAFVLAFAVVPVALAIAGGIGSEGGAASLDRAVGNPVSQRAIWNSVNEGAVSALAAVGIGYPVGVFLGRNAFPGRSALLSALLVPFLLPTVAVVLGIEEIFSPNGFLGGGLAALRPLSGGFAGILVTNIVFNVPVVIVLTVVGVESASGELEEAVASLGGSPIRRFRDVWALPSALGAAAGGLLTFLFSALAFAGPLLIGGPSWYTIEARIYTLSQLEGEPGAAAVLALVAIALFAAPTVLYLWLVRRLRSGAPRHGRGPLTHSGLRPIRLVLGAVTAFWVAATFLLLGAVVWRMVAPSAPGRSWGDPLRGLFSPRVTDALGISTSGAIANTILFAGFAVGIALLVAITYGFASSRRSGTGEWVGGFAFAPLLISPVVLALALAYTWRGVAGTEASVAFLIVVSQATLALPFAMQAISGPVNSISRGPAEVARSLGASPWQAYLDVALPQASAGVRAAGLFAFALGLGEFTATNFLATPATTTLTVELYRLQGIRLGEYAQAIAGLLVLTSLGVLLAIGLWGGRRAELL